MRPARKLRPGEQLHAADGAPVARGRRAHGGRRHVHASSSSAPATRSTLADHGEMPLPPYITHPPRPTRPLPDRVRRRAGSAAAPTAGLHLTAGAARARSRRRASTVAPVELVVGLDTFQPVSERRPARPPHAQRALPRAGGDVDGVPRRAGASSPSARRASGPSRARRRPGELGGPHRAVHPPRRTTWQRRRRADDQLPPAAHDAADDDRRVRRAALARALRRRRSPRATASCPSATPCSSTATPDARCLAPRHASTIEATDGAARAGVATTARGHVPHAVLHAGRHPRRGQVPRAPPTTSALGAEIVLGNTYHLMLRPGRRVVARFGGLGAFAGWDGLTLTDSRRLPGVLARAEGRRRRRHVPQHLRRLDAPLHAGVGGRHPGAARRRHPDGARRVPAAAEPARGRSRSPSSAPRRGRRGPAPRTAATTRRCSASSRAASTRRCGPRARERTVDARLRRLRHRRAVAWARPAPRCCRRSPRPSPTCPPTGRAT